MPPDIADIMHGRLGIITHLADGTPLSVNEVQRALIDNYRIERALIDNYRIEPLDLEGHIPQWDFEEIVQKPTGNPTAELVPFTDSELTELLFGE